MCAESVTLSGMGLVAISDLPTPGVQKAGDI